MLHKVKYFLYLILPFLFQSLKTRFNSQGQSFFDILTILSIWLPIEFLWLPQVEVYQVPMMIPFGMILLIMIYHVMTPLETSRTFIRLQRMGQIPSVALSSKNYETHEQLFL